MKFDDIVKQNVEAIAQIEEAVNAGRTRSDVIADSITSFCGSTLFLYVHCGWFAVWLLWNTWGPHSGRFDPPPYGVLTLIVSLEAIFLSTFILISQNRQQLLADKRNRLDLQINLLAEQESSLLLGMMKQVMDHLKIEHQDIRANALTQDTDPKLLAEEISRIENGDSASN